MQEIGVNIVNLQQNAPILELYYQRLEPSLSDGASAEEEGLDRFDYYPITKRIVVLGDNVNLFHLLCVLLSDASQNPL